MYHTTNCFTGYLAVNITVNITIPTQSAAVPVRSVFGWIIIHQHLGYIFNWNRSWADYKDGFGSIGAQFWLGLEKVHLLTSSQPYRLRVELRSRSTKLWYSAEYWSFQIGDELNDSYRLQVDGYSGDAGDAFCYTGDSNGNGNYGHYLHNGMAFSTFDRDNDNNTINCASYRRGGWWYNGCYWVCLTCNRSNHAWYSLPTFKVVISRMMIKPQ